MGTADVADIAIQQLENVELGIPTRTACGRTQMAIDHKLLPGQDAPNCTSDPVLATRLYAFVSALIWWQDPANSVVALSVGVLAWYLTTLGGYTVVTLCGYVATLYIGACLLHINAVYFWTLYSQAGDAIKFRRNFPETEQWVTAADVKSVAEVAASRTNAALRYSRDIVHCRSVEASLKALGFALLVSMIGWIFDGVTLIALAYVLALTVPISYKRNQKKVDRVLARFKRVGTDLYSRMAARVKDFMRKRGYSPKKTTSNKQAF